MKTITLLRVPGKGGIKRCSFGGCLSDSRYTQSVSFIPFAKPCLKVRKSEIEGNESHIKDCALCEKCVKWMSMCQREDLTTFHHVTKNIHLCSLHFVNGHEFSKIFPDPLPAKTVTEIRNAIGKRIVVESPRFSKEEKNVNFAVVTVENVATETLKPEGHEEDPLQINVSQIEAVNSKAVVTEKMDLIGKRKMVESPGDAKKKKRLNIAVVEMGSVATETVNSESPEDPLNIKIEMVNSEGGYYLSCNSLPSVSILQQLEDGSTHRSTQANFTWNDLETLQVLQNEKRVLTLEVDTLKQKIMQLENGNGR